MNNLSSFSREPTATAPASTAVIAGSGLNEKARIESWLHFNLKSLPKAEGRDSVHIEAIYDQCQLS
jgi:hypothetical protein